MPDAVTNVLGGVFDAKITAEEKMRGQEFIVGKAFFFGLIVGVAIGYIGCILLWHM